MVNGKHPASQVLELARFDHVRSLNVIWSVQLSEYNEIQVLLRTNLYTPANFVIGSAGPCVLAA